VRSVLEEVRNADAVLLIIGKRYGFVPTVKNPEALSATHLEFREARKNGKTRVRLHSTRRDQGGRCQEIAARGGKLRRRSIAKGMGNKRVIGNRGSEIITVVDRKISASLDFQGR